MHIGCNRLALTATRLAPPRMAGSSSAESADGSDRVTIGGREAPGPAGKVTAAREPLVWAPLQVGLLFPTYNLADRLFKDHVHRLLEGVNAPGEGRHPYAFREVGACGSLADYGRAARDLVERSDVVVIPYDGTEVDTVAAFASGYAFGLGKPVIAIRTDARPAGESEKTNLMLSQTAYGLILSQDGTLDMGQVSQALDDCRTGYAQAQKRVTDLRQEFVHGEAYKLPFAGLETTTRTKVYPAGGLFTAGERSFDRIFEQFLKNESYFPIWPWRNAVPSDFRLPREQMDKVLMGKCIRGIHSADVVVANTDGSKVDDGTAFEIGYSLALGKPTITYRTDFRTTEVLKNDQGQKRGVFEGLVPVVDVSLPTAVDSYVEPILTDLLSARESFRPLLDKMAAVQRPDASAASLPSIVARFGDPAWAPPGADNRNDVLEVLLPLPALDTRPDKLRDFRPLLVERLSPVAFHYGRGPASVPNPLGGRDPLEMRVCRRYHPQAQFPPGEVAHFADEIEFSARAGQQLNVSITYLNSSAPDTRIGHLLGDVPGHLVVRFNKGCSDLDWPWLSSDSPPAAETVPPWEISRRELRELSDATKAAIHDLLVSM